MTDLCLNVAGWQNGKRCKPLTPLHHVDAWTAYEPRGRAFESLRARQLYKGQQSPALFIALSTLRAFWTGKAAYSDAREPTLAWYRHVLKADWRSPAEVKREFGSASILSDGRVVFNIAGNKYRIVVWINYPYRVLYIRFIGSHAQYDRIDAQTI